MFFGAEFTQVFGRKYGYTINPSKHAQRTSDFILRKQRLEAEAKKMEEEKENTEAQ